MGEPNQAYWRGIRPTDPPENIPVDIKACSVTLPVGIVSVIGNMPVDVKAHTVNTPVDVKSHAVNTPVDVKSMTGNMPVDVKAHTVNTPVDVKSHDVDTPVKDSWLGQGCDGVAAGSPADGTVLVDTGPLAAGKYDIFTLMTCTVNHDNYRWEHRNAANDDTIDVIYFFTGIYFPVQFTIPNISIDANERVRVLLHNAIVGNIAGGLWWTKRA